MGSHPVHGISDNEVYKVRDAPSLARRRGNPWGNIRRPPGRVVPPCADQSWRSFHRSEFETRDKKADYRYPIPFRLVGTGGRKPLTCASQIGRIATSSKARLAPFVAEARRRTGCADCASRENRPADRHSLVNLSRQPGEHYAQFSSWLAHYHADKSTLREICWRVTWPRCNASGSRIANGGIPPVHRNHNWGRLKL